MGTGAWAAARTPTRWCSTRAEPSTRSTLARLRDRGGASAHRVSARLHLGAPEPRGVHGGAEARLGQTATAFSYVCLRRQGERLDPAATASRRTSPGILKSFAGTAMPTGSCARGRRPPPGLPGTGGSAITRSSSTACGSRALSGVQKKAIDGVLGERRLAPRWALVLPPAQQAADGHLRRRRAIQESVACHVSAAIPPPRAC
jgi:hypothetical protein